jgi:hypothetical protein
MARHVAAGLVAGAGLLLLLHGAGEEAARAIIRWTARCSLLFLCAAMAAEGLRARLPAWGSRQELLRSLALSHTVHALAIFALALLTDGRNLVERSEPIAVLGGALAYVFLFWGALFPRSRVTSLGLFWIWGVFMLGFGTRALRMPLPYGFAVVLLVAAMLTRLWALRSSVAPHTGEPVRAS